MNIVFLLLSKNEQASIGQVIQDIHSVCRKNHWQNFQVVLADDSTDSTPEISRGLGATVLNCGNRGLGNAFRVGMDYIAKLNVDYVCIMDTDGQTNADEIKLFFDPVIQSQCDMTIGSRFQQSGKIDYAYPWVNRMGTYLLSNYLSFMVGTRLTDSHGGLRVMRASYARGMKIWGRWTYVQESIIEVSRMGGVILELPCIWKERKQGLSRVVHSPLKYAIRVGPILFLRILQKIFVKKNNNHE